ncbi:MAG: prolipoprotein diacylglyceryl transferase [Pedosphaera sp.]|nr:prolipoprotein diacylglyceryl transferase [Pedosphaera sp.]
MHPIAFPLGALKVHWYGVLLAVAFLSGLWTAARRAPRTGVAPEKISDVGLWLMIGTVIGARLFYVVTYWRESFAGQPFWEIFMIQRGGLVFYGGLIGASLACILFCRRHKLALWKVADVLAPSIALGYVFGRIGCLMNGCCFGRECSLPWAIHFPADHATGGAGVHPTQIYDSLLNLALYLALAWLYRRKKFDGQVFAGYLIGYAVARSFVEIFRGDYSVAHRHGALTPAHLLSIGIFAAGVVLFVVLRQKTIPAK